METSFRLTKTPPTFYSPLSTKSKTQVNLIILHPVKSQHVQPGHWSLKLRQPVRLTGGLRASSVCGEGNAATEFERKMEDEMKSMEEEEECIGVAENCREADGGIVELMECLEREAIMGKDEGRDPMDYNRRAHIFDKSSKVFQALKESSTPAAAAQEK